MKKSVVAKDIKQYNSAFTIVELLVVIVVIAVLATISIVSYTGIRQKAVIATIQSDLNNASTQLEIYKIDNGEYPTGVTDCPSPSGGNICLKLSSGNSVISYTTNNSANPPTYSLAISNSSFNLAYRITDSTRPTEAVSGWKGLSAGNSSHACAIGSDDRVYCWGVNSYGELGNNSTTNSSVPMAVNTSGVLAGKTIKAISAGWEYTCVIASDNQAYCWGYGSSGQLGNSSTTDSSVPVAVNTLGVLSGKTIMTVVSGFNHTCAIASDDQAYCWGGNGSGQLGNNSLTNSSVPVMVLLP